MNASYPQPIPEPRWQHACRLRRGLVPEGLRDWLLEPGSLTRRLRACCPGEFQVVLLDQQLARPLRSEAQALGRPAHELALIRQVHLCCDGSIWVYARTVVPLPSLQRGLKRLTGLGTRPLGEVLFADPQMQRSPVEVARLPPGHALYALSGSEDGQALWGRRSVFTLQHRPLLVSEFFLSRLLDGDYR